MLRPITKPPIDPLAHRAAIEAMEAQRAAYQRYARTVEMQRATLGDGDGDRALAAVDAATRDFVELGEGARRLEPLVAAVRDGGSEDQLREMQRQMEQLMRDARQAENAIHDMTSQLEAWRDAYGRQLAELGLRPGAGREAGDGTVAPDPRDVLRETARDAAAAREPYGGRARGPGAPSVIDRKG